jgi:hypothetical protein
MARTAVALVWIAAVAALAIYTARRPTIARGDVIADDLLDHYPTAGWRALACDREIPIGVAGARFRCVAELDDGRRSVLDVALDREGTFHVRAR